VYCACTYAIVVLSVARAPLPSFLAMAVLSLCVPLYFFAFREGTRVQDLYRRFCTTTAADGSSSSSSNGASENAKLAELELDENS